MDRSMDRTAEGARGWQRKSGWYRAHLPPCRACHASVSSSLRSWPRMEQSCGRLTGLRSPTRRIHAKMRRAQGRSWWRKGDGAWCGGIAAEGTVRRRGAGGGAVRAAGRCGLAIVPDDDDFSRVKSSLVVSKVAKRSTGNHVAGTVTHSKSVLHL